MNNAENPKLNNEHLTVSVVMSTYNGARFIREQLDSIVGQLGVDDELVISDDGSTDSTVDIIREYLNKYGNSESRDESNRDLNDVEKELPETELIADKSDSSVVNPENKFKIRLVQGPGKGASLNFENGIKAASGDIIFIADQDDIWKPGKIDRVKELFIEEEKTQLVLHNCSFCDVLGRLSPGTNFEARNTKHGFLKNFIKSSYNGCCMAARREFLEKTLPLVHPDVLYDQYFGMVAEKKKCSRIIPDILTVHRIHDSNVTETQSVKGKIYYRYMLLKQYIRLQDHNYE